MIKINHNNNICQSKFKDFIILLISLFLIQTIFHILCFNEFELIGIYFFIYRVHINHFIISIGLIFLPEIELIFFIVESDTSEIISSTL